MATPDDADDRAPGTGVAEAQLLSDGVAVGQNRRARVSSTTTTSRVPARSPASSRRPRRNLVPTASKYPGVTARTLATSFGSSGPGSRPLMKKLTRLAVAERAVDERPARRTPAARPRARRAAQKARARRLRSCGIASSHGIDTRPTSTPSGWKPGSTDRSSPRLRNSSAATTSSTTDRANCPPRTRRRAGGRPLRVAASHRARRRAGRPAPHGGSDAEGARRSAPSRRREQQHREVERRSRARAARRPASRARASSARRARCRGSIRRERAAGSRRTAGGRCATGWRRGSAERDLAGAALAAAGWRRSRRR